MAGNVPSGYSDEDDALLTDINVTPLVDVTLVLLIVFMITVPAIVGSAPIKVDLPNTTAAKLAAENLPLSIFLRREASGEIGIYLNNKQIDEKKLGMMLPENIGDSEGQPARISADKGIPYGEVIRIVDLLGSHGIRKISLDTKHVGP